MTTKERNQELPESALDHLVERNHLRVSSRTFEAFTEALDEPLSDAAIHMLTKRAPWELDLPTPGWGAAPVEI